MVLYARQHRDLHGNRWLCLPTPLVTTGPLFRTVVCGAVFPHRRGAGLLYGRDLHHRLCAHLNLRPQHLATPTERDPLVVYRLRCDRHDHPSCWRGAGGKCILEPQKSDNVQSHPACGSGFPSFLVRRIFIRASLGVGQRSKIHGQGQFWVPGRFGGRYAGYLS